MVPISHLSFTQNSLHPYIKHTLITNIKPKAILNHPHSAAPSVEKCWLEFPLTAPVHVEAKKV